MLEQLRPPLRVGDVGLAARHVAHVAGVDHPHLADRVLQHPVDRFPIHPGRFHPHQRHLPLDQPVGQRQQLRGRRAELGHLLAAATATIRCARARHHRVAVHIQERAPLDDHLHHRPPSIDDNARASRMGASSSKKLRYVLEATKRSARDPRVKLTTGSKRHRNTTSARPTHPDSHPTRAAPPGAMLTTDIQP